MAAFRLYIEQNFGGRYIEGSGQWMDISDRCENFGAVTFSVKGDYGQLVVDPPSQLLLQNADGFFITAPATVGGALEGPLAGRRVKITLERWGIADQTLGTFKVAAEGGVQIRRDRFVELRLESLAATLERAEASQVSSGNGWFQQVPWTMAAKMTASTLVVGSLTLPDAPLPYETLDSAISLAGKPGDYVAGQFELGGVVLATDCCYNQDEDCFVYATLDKLWKLLRTTGEWQEITGAGLAAIPDGWDILRVWYKPQERVYSGAPVYFVLAAQAEVASQSSSAGSGYWQPKDQAYKWTQIRLYAHDNATPLFDSSTSYKPALAPVVYREEIENGTLGTVNNSVIGGEPITGGGWTDKPENVAIPFGQYVAWLAMRRDQAGETPGSGVSLTRRDTTYIGADATYFDPLDSVTSFTPNLWSDYPRAGAGARQAMNLDDIRMGRGYYRFYAIWGATWNHDTNRDLGVRYSMGQGPMVDISFKHTPAGGDDRYDCWLAFLNWDLANFRYQVQVVGVRNGTDYPASAVSFDPYVMPTFVVCDIFDSGGGSLHTGGAVFVGWFDPFTGTAYRHYYAGAAFNVEGAESGVAILQANTCNAGSTPVLDTNIRAMTFTPTTAADTGNRYYWTTKPAGGAGVVHHVSGRWVPVAGGIFREKPDGQPVIYRLALSCFDRSECLPDPRNGRTGQAYRLLLCGVTWNTSGTLLMVGADTNGTFGKDTGYWASMPIMGMTKLGVKGSAERATLDDPAIYFLSSEGGALYTMRESLSYTALWLGRVQAADTFLGLGLLAVKKPANQDETEVAGVSNPTFPLTANARWPVGEYYAWTYGPSHSGRLPLLDMADLTRWDALGLITMAADSQFYFTRSGAPVVAKVPSGNPTPVATLTPSDFSSATRSDAPVTNLVTRSVNDVVPGDFRVSVMLAPKSEWNLSPSFSGMGVYPLDIEVKCILGGMVSETITDDPRLGKTNWAWRESGKRIAATASTDSAAGFIGLENLADIETGDLVTIDGDSRDLIVLQIVSYALRIIQVSPVPTTQVKAGDTVWIQKQSDGHYSSEFWWDAQLGAYRGATAVAVAASAGAVQISVKSGHPFSVGSFFSIGVKNGLLDDPSGPYRVLRVRRGREESRPGVFDIVEFEAVKAGQTGLVEAAAAGDPIAVWLNISSASRSVGIGQTGVVFSIDGGAGGDAATSTERPALEGDKVLLSYPGLILKKNSRSKVTARDLAHIRQNGTKTAAKVPANKLLDYNLALMDVERRLRRGTDGRLILELEGCRDILPDGTDIATLEPLTILEVEDPILLADRAADGYKATFSLISHTITQQMDISLKLEEVAGAIPGRPAPAFARGDLWTPADLPDLELWLRADSLRQQGVQDGNSVPWWRDESGNERHALAYSTTVSTWPTVVVESDIYTVDFASASLQALAIGDFEMLNNGQGQSITVLGRKRTAMSSANGQFISKYNTNAPGYREWFMKAFYYTVQEVATAFDANTQVAHNGNESWAVVMGSWAAGAAPEGYKNGTLQATAVSAVNTVDDTTATVYIGAERNGATNNLDGRIVEIIVTSNPLSVDDRTNLMAYFRRTYPALVTGGAGFDSGFDSGFGA